MRERELAYIDLLSFSEPAVSKCIPCIPKWTIPSCVKHCSLFLALSVFEETCSLCIEQCEMVPRWAIVAILLCGLVAVGQSQYVTTIAGSAGTSGHANGPGAAATFFHPAFLAATSTDLYIADYGNNLIRKIDLASSNVTTIAGGGSSGTDWGHADGIGTSATFNEPYGIAVSGNDLYVSDYLNNLIRHVDLTSREVKTIAGGGVNFP